MQVEILGNIEGIEIQNGALFIKTAVADARVTVYNDTIIRVCITRRDKQPDQSLAVIQGPSGELNYHDLSDTIEVNTSAMKLVVNKNPLRFNFFTADGKPLTAEDTRFGTTLDGDKVMNYRQLHHDEMYLGLGEKTGNLNKRGMSYVNWNTDAAVHTTKDDPLYKTIPFYIGLHSGVCYGLFFDNHHRSYFDFGASTDEQFTWFGADGGDMDYYVFGAQNVADIIKDYTWLTGRMEMPPLWSLGYQQCRWSYMSADEVLGIARKFREHQIPADAIYCDIDYMDDFKIFTWNKQSFPDPKGMVDQLKAINFKLVTIVDPGIKIEEGYKEYDEGVAKGYFATYPNGELYTGSVWAGRSHFPDFFSEDVREWWGNAFRSLTDVGVEGFWNDMNEPAAWGQNIPPIVKFGERYMPEVRNAYGMQMSRATQAGTKKILENQRPFILTRAAYAGTQRYSAIWTGDNSASDEHMLFGQRLVNSLGLGGFSFIGVDIGGFMGNPSPQLMVRWNSLGVYTPMFRNHAAQGMNMREPWEWGEENENIIRKDIEQRYKLLPYIYSGFYQSTQTGLPLSRTLAIDYTWDENVYKERFQNQTLFGDALLVAPVISTEQAADVYLPEGEWYRFSTDEHFEGNQTVNVPSPLNDLPVFVKGGSIIPMQSLVQSTSDECDGILQIHVWNGAVANEYVYYEDDGISYNYEKGEYYKRVILFSPEERSISFSAVEGSYTSRFNKLQIVLHGFDGLEVIERESSNEALTVNF
ncbi:glycoside hydrolase family 31 protein [Mucilaginibacter auburnensis]|uniref:Alpha-glucosidase n=1 Tax=Mucilaginibacter auburnensis TaxID=1457233 RepID=A0A2H9VPV7_9SPHI|nr:glycoside hydrolase family 31 protein [Mucilaginibacter auburnensis]PJJ80355.1 alpha-glucosidase [Mucilaginibacter auburnensis]